MHFTVVQKQGGDSAIKKKSVLTERIQKRRCHFHANSA